MSHRSSTAAKRVQEPFLNELRKSRRAVQVYLRSGQRLEGVLTSFDPHMIQLQGTQQQMVFKHEIMSIARAPVRKARSQGDHRLRSAVPRPAAEEARRPARPLLKLKKERQTEPE